MRYPSQRGWASLSLLRTRIELKGGRREDLPSLCLTAGVGPSIFSSPQGQLNYLLILSIFSCLLWFLLVYDLLVIILIFVSFSVIIHVLRTLEEVGVKIYGMHSIIYLNYNKIFFLLDKLI